MKFVKLKILKQFYWVFFKLSASRRGSRQNSWRDSWRDFSRQRVSPRVLPKVSDRILCMTLSETLSADPMHDSQRDSFFYTGNEIEISLSVILENVNTFCDNLEQAMAQLGKNYSPSNIYNLIVKRSLFIFFKIKKYKSSEDHLVFQS